MSKKSLATFVGNCNQPPKENNLYKQFKPLLELHFFSGSFILLFSRSFDTNTETRLWFPKLWSWSYTINITIVSKYVPIVLWI